MESEAGPSLAGINQDLNLLLCKVKSAETFMMSMLYSELLWGNGEVFALCVFEWPNVDVRDLMM